MADAPNSYKDPYWTNLSTMMEKKHGLPSGLLVNIVQKGEKTNSDKRSPVGAKTVYQIMPNTRDLFLKKYGVDAFASPKAAAEVAALHLKESLQRNKGDVSLAVREYHGGPNRSGWGKVNDAYVGRVIGEDTQQTERPSRLDRARQRVSSRRELEQPSLDSIYRAYKGGQMSAQEKADYERDVKNGSIMLARGQSLNKGKKSQEQNGVLLPQGVADAYYKNTMTLEDRADLERDRKSGLVRLPMPTNLQSSFPKLDQQGNVQNQQSEFTEVIEPKPQATLGQQLAAIPETALALGSSIVGAPVGQVIGTFKGAAKSLIDGTFGTQEGGKQALQEANQMAQAFTYEPSNTVSREQLQTVGNAIEGTGLNTLPPVLGGLGSAAGTLAKAGAPQAISAARGAAQAAAPVVQNVAQAVAKPVVNAGQAVRSGVGKVAETLGIAEAQPQRQGANMGAAQVNPASMRTEQFQDLPIPIERVTEGQVSRDPMILKSESEASKLPVGEQFRKVQEEQHEIANMNLEKFNEMTGAELADPRAVGQTVDKALKAELGKDKARVKAAYNAASSSEEAKTPVDLTNRIDFSNEMVGKVTTDDGVTTTTLIDYLNDQVPSVTEPILDSAKSLAVKHGLAIKEGDALIPTVPTIKQMEAFRKDIVAKTDTMKSPDVRQATILKKLVDAHTEPYEGKLYQTARSAKRAQAKRWESNGIVKSLLGTKKGTDDRVVALEDVADKIVSKGSLDDMRVAKRLLLTSGDDGKQAWKEIQGSVIQQIKDASTAGIAADAEGRQMISPAKLNSAIMKLDQDGKLNYLFGRQGADQLRNLNDVSKALFTVPMSAAINHSNTASAMAIVLDTIASGATTGLPLPLVTVLREGAKKVKDAKQRKAINKSIINLSRGSSI